MEDIFSFYLVFIEVYLTKSYFMIIILIFFYIHMHEVLFSKFKLNYK